jgi:6-phosphogluconate dehydrogenase (decarboxylating)
VRYFPVSLFVVYEGMGVSGGESGARNGPSMMPGGPKEAYDSVKPVLEKIAAQVNDGPCVTYIGKGGAGNYVKMIHNGIEVSVRSHNHLSTLILQEQVCSLWSCFCLFFWAHLNPMPAFSVR